MEDYEYNYRPNASNNRLPPPPSASSSQPNGWTTELPPLPPPPARRYPPKGSSSSSTSSSGWGFNDAEMKRRRRVATYKAYTVEGRVKASLRKGLRWIKLKCTEIVHGW